MAHIKMTFSVDEETAARIRDAADALRKPKSQVVREAIADYAYRVGRLSESERRRLLGAFDELVPAIPARPEYEVSKSSRRYVVRVASAGEGFMPMVVVDTPGLTTNG